MAEPKISFGFTKLLKPNKLRPTVATNVKNDKNDGVQMIDCLEGNSIKVIRNHENVEVKPTIMPQTNVIWAKRLELAVLKTAGKKNHQQSHSKAATNCESVSDLDKQAAEEIIQDLTNAQVVDTNVTAVPVSETAVTEAKESTLEDYEEVPVDEKYGLRLLLGMGFDENKIKKTGDDKNLPLMPRPKGLGLGADKVVKTAVNVENGDGKNTETELPMVNAAYVKIINGRYKDVYGQIQGFDEDGVRAIIKLAISGEVITLSKYIIKVVTKDDYQKNSKILNLSKFNEYHEKKTQEDDNHPKSSREMQKSRNKRDKSEKSHRKNYSDLKSRNNSQTRRNCLDSEHSKSRYHKKSSRRSSISSDSSYETYSRKHRSKHSKQKSSRTNSDDEYHRNHTKSTRKHSDESDSDTYERKRQREKKSGRSCSGQNYKRKSSNTRTQR